jgi:probable HAF family extracellular repeat protein
MSAVSTRFMRWSATLLVVASAFACGERGLTAPEAPGIEPARAPAGGGPSVRATDPDTGFRNTTFDVQVFGSGFDQGSRAVWALNGDTAFTTTNVRINSTRYVSSKKLIANLTIGREAPLDLYDVILLTAGGKKGIGLELFAVTYQITDLGTLGGLSSWAGGVNSAGEVVGWAHLASGEQRPFRWTAAEGMRDLGTFGGTRHEAVAINDAGVVVGTGSSPTASFLAFRWTSAEGLAPLDQTLGASTEAFAVNALGDVGGRASPAGTGPYPAAVWTAGGVLEGLTDSWARVLGLNDVGQAVGFSHPTGPTRAVLWTRAAGGWTMEELPVGEDSQAHDINNAGQVVGFYRTTDGRLAGFVWTREAGVDSLPALPGGAGGTTAHAINDAGQVVGWSDHRTGGQSAVVWTRGTDARWHPLALPQLGQGNSEARAISADGKIVGWENQDQGSHAVLWRLP